MLAEGAVRRTGSCGSCPGITTKPPLAGSGRLRLRCPVIIWLNGTFGVGKTTICREVLQQLPDARFWDPEFVGYMLQPLLQDRPVANFQDWPAWREIVVATGVALWRQTRQPLVAPQTVLNAAYMREIRAGFRARDLPLFEVLLDAPEDVMRERILGDAVEPESARQWRLDHLQSWSDERARMQQEADLVLDTSQLTAAEAARRVTAAAGVYAP